MRTATEIADLIERSQFSVPLSTEELNFVAKVLRHVAKHVPGMWLVEPRNARALATLMKAPPTAGAQIVAALRRHQVKVAGSLAGATRRKPRSTRPISLCARCCVRSATPTLPPRPGWTMPSPR